MLLNNVNLNLGHGTVGPFCLPAGSWSVSLLVHLVDPVTHVQRAGTLVLLFPGPTSLCQLDQNDRCENQYTGFIRFGPRNNTRDGLLVWKAIDPGPAEIACGMTHERRSALSGIYPYIIATNSD